MTEAEFEYECERAELLGIEKPDRNQFLGRRNDNSEMIDQTELITRNTESAKELDEQGEKISRGASGLDEINSILKVTQKKINRLKAVGGSFKSILKLRSDSSKTNASDNGSEKAFGARTDASAPSSPLHGKLPKVSAKTESSSSDAVKTSEWDIQSTVDTQMGKLDSLISKAEKADVSLCSQNKQMRKFLRN